MTAAEPPPHSHGLKYGALGAEAAHLCVDMQRMFAEGTDWATPWLPRVLPNVIHLVERHPERTVFTRFIPAASADESRGTWRRYYRHWSNMTLRELGGEMVDLVGELGRFAPPAAVVDKPVYSPWWTPDLRRHLDGRRVSALIITGAETDVCVLATALGAIDLGYRVVIVTDALCSSSDESHDAMTALYHRRFGQQVETASTDEVLAVWG